ncbi:hypothetical protein IAI10_19610 [Clostridium sp. 19966]|uniref:hypothetical protein n=1 Tax=Clostridium sp. 19966 TaxID=2768166 RepID=UPI0028DFE068|nr:hypothetical protein [Clostridium sp. 19966]MDT8718865.1 hypothetical protein [Clostridium sp. 19966]
MKSMKWTFYKRVMIFCVTFLFFGNTFITFAFESQDNMSLKAENMYVDSNGAQLKYTVNNNSIDLKVDSENLNKGYYTANLYSKGSYNWGNFGMAAFNIKNNSDGDLKFNFLVVKKDGTYLSVTSDKTVLIKKENEELIEKTAPSYGTINIAKGFQGMIYVPLDSLKSKIGDDKPYSFSDIAAWGIGITTEENKEKQVVLRDFSLISKNDPLVGYGNLNFYIQGEDRVQIPVQGESIALYKSSLNNEQVNYRLEDNASGVYISKDGKLTLTTNAKEGKIKIEAVYGNLAVEKEIQLFKSWTLSAKEVDGTSKSIPAPGEVKNLLSGIYPLIMSAAFINSIRIGALVLAVIFLYLYIIWKRVK